MFGEILGDDDKQVVDSVRQDDTITKVTVEGDVDALLEAQSERVAEWNKVLDARS